VQVRDAADKPFTVVVSRDGLHRYALPYIKSEEEDPWPPEVFVPVVPFEVLDLTDLRHADPTPVGAVPPGPVSAVLDVQRAMAYYDALCLKVTEDQPDLAVRGMAELTWPILILMPEDEHPGWIVREQPQRMEDYLHPVPAGQDLRDAVQLSVNMRNLLHWGSTDVPGGGYDPYLTQSLPHVLRINALGAEAAVTGEHGGD